MDCGENNLKIVTNTAVKLIDTGEIKINALFDLPLLNLYNELPGDDVNSHLIIWCIINYSQRNNHCKAGNQFSRTTNYFDEDDFFQAQPWYYIKIFANDSVNEKKSADTRTARQK